MKLKATIPSLITLASLLTACSKVSEDDRLIYVEPVPVTKTVLVEEYSGQDCFNCPNGATILEELQEQYGDNLAIITYHGGSYAYYPGQYDGILGLGTEYGEKMEKAYGIDIFGKPSMIVNAGTPNNTVDTWARDIAAAFKTESDVALKGEAFYDEVSSSIQIWVTGTCNSVYDGDLQVILTENGIVALQKMPDQSYNMEYVHNNIFRSTVNSEVGEPFKVSAADLEGVTKTYTVPVQAEWKPTNMRVVAFVSNEHGVQQALTMPVKKLVEQPNDNN